MKANTGGLSSSLFFLARSSHHVGDLLKSWNVARRCSYRLGGPQRRARTAARARLSGHRVPPRKCKNYQSK
jgi:hypothetical protein